MLRNGSELMRHHIYLHTKLHMPPCKTQNHDHGATAAGAQCITNFLQKSSSRPQTVAVVLHEAKQMQSALVKSPTIDVTCNKIASVSATLCLYKDSSARRASLVGSCLMYSMYCSLSTSSHPAKATSAVLSSPAATAQPARHAHKLASCRAACL